MLKTYLNTLKSSNTREAYARAIENYLAECGNEITYMSYLNWVGSISDKSSATQHLYETAVCGYVKFLYDLNQIDSETYMKISTHKRARVHSKEKLSITKEQVAEMIDSGRNPREKAMMALLFSTGLRVSELINIKLDDVKSDTIQIRRKGGKYSHIYLNDISKKMIAYYLKYRKDCDCDNLFVSNQGTPMKRQMINNMMKIIAGKVGVDVEAINFSTHSARHTCLTLMSEAGVPLEVMQQVASHSSVETTRKYISVSENRVKNAMMAIEF